MLHQDIPFSDISRTGASGRWLAPVLVVAAALSAGVLALMVGQGLLAAVALIAGVGAALYLMRKAAPRVSIRDGIAAGPDYALVGAALGLSADACALSMADGGLLIANAAYRERFGAKPPLDLGIDEEAGHGLELARTLATRDGAGCVAGIATRAGACPVEVERAGISGELLMWRFPQAPPQDPVNAAVRRVQGQVGEDFAAAGVLAAVVDAKGKLIAANRAFMDRAQARTDKPRSVGFSDLVEMCEGEQMRLTAEGEAGRPFRAVYVPSGQDGDDAGAGTFLLFGSDVVSLHAPDSNLQALLDVLPIGLALADRDGRFLSMNRA
ncbi:MAG: PAS domain-containing protein, partial [Sphingomicrobium sp.]